MADSNTPLLGLLLQETGGNNNTWGQLLNEQVIEYVEAAIAGKSAVSTTGGSTVLTAAQNRTAILDITGTLGSNAILQVSNLSHVWMVRNGCTLGGFTVSIKTSGGSAEVIPAGTSVVWCDGNDVVTCFGSSTDLEAVVGGTFASPVKAPDGTEAAPGRSWSGDTNTGWRRSASGTERFSADGTDTLQVSSAGIRALAGDFLDVNGNAAGVPVGAVIDYAGDTAPAGYLLCFGQAVSRTTYSRLFTAIGVTYGVGDSSTTFNLPNVEGRVIAGRDDMSGSAAGRLTTAGSGIDGTELGAAGGAQAHTLTQAQLPALALTFEGVAVADHRHLTVHDTNVSTGDSLTSGNSMVRARDGGAGEINYSLRASGTTEPGISRTSEAGGHTPTGAVKAGSSTTLGSGDAHSSVQATIVMNKIIKF